QTERLVPRAVIAVHRRRATAQHHVALELDDLAFRPAASDEAVGLDVHGLVPRGVRHAWCKGQTENGDEEEACSPRRPPGGGSPSARMASPTVNRDPVTRTRPREPTHARASARASATVARARTGTFHSFTSRASASGSAARAVSGAVVNTLRHGPASARRKP